MPRIRRRHLLALLLTAGTAWADADTLPDPPPARRAELIHIVRQDCGSCHGLTLKGGLGPALSPAALAGKPLSSLAATIVHGRPGTPMPAFKGIIDDAEAAWIAERLSSAFPTE